MTILLTKSFRSVSACHKQARLAGGCFSVHCSWYNLRKENFVVSPPGASREILRAEPETFIHIFVHKKDKLIEFLEHMTKVSKYGFIESDL